MQRLTEVLSQLNFDSEKHEYWKKLGLPNIPSDADKPIFLGVRSPSSPNLEFRSQNKEFIENMARAMSKLLKIEVPIHSYSRLALLKKYSDPHDSTYLFFKAHAKETDDTEYYFYLSEQASRQFLAFFKIDLDHFVSQTFMRINN